MDVSHFQYGEPQFLVGEGSRVQGVSKDVLYIQYVRCLDIIVNV